MAVPQLPTPPDNTEYWIYVPAYYSLYGSDARPMRFLRVVDALPGGSERVIHTYQDNPSNPDSIVMVESVGIDTFVDYATFGYTPYLECAFCGHKNGMDLTQHKHLFLAQSALRNYEARCRDLLDIAQEKRLSLSTSSMSNDKTKALINELQGALAMWEMLMNTGAIKALNALSYIPAQGGTSMPVKQLAEKLEELEERMLMNNFSPLPFKVTQQQREAVRRAFK